MFTYTLFNADLDNPTIVESNPPIEEASIETVLHGGFGALTGKLGIRESRFWPDWYKWYNNYLGYRLVAYNEIGSTIFEGRLEDITPVPGFGIQISALGYWSACYDEYFEDLTTYDSGTHTADEIIKAILTKSCPAISSDHRLITSLSRNVAPIELNLERPGDLIKRILEPGDANGDSIYFAIWEGRKPQLITYQTSSPKWLVYMADLVNPAVTPRSLKNYYTAVRAEYQIAGEEGTVNDSGTATGEDANNRVTVTDTEKEWEIGHWNDNMELVTTGGVGTGQTKDIKDTRKKPNIIVPAIPMSSVVDTGTCEFANEGGTNYDEIGISTSERYPGIGAVDLGHYPTDAFVGYYIEMLSGSYAGEERQIVGHDAGISRILKVSPGFSGYVSGKFRIYHKSRLFRMDGEDFVADAYNEGHVAEIVNGFGTRPPQQFKITDTVVKYVVSGGEHNGWTLPAYIEVEPVIDSSQVGPAYAGSTLATPADRLSRPEIPSYKATTYTGTVLEQTASQPYFGATYAEIQKQQSVLKAGTATGGSDNTITYTVAALETWTSASIEIKSGTCANQIRAIKSCSYEPSTQTETLTVVTTWDDDVPDITSKFQIRATSETEEKTDPEANQLLLTTPLDTAIDNTTTYEIRQKKEGGTVTRTLSQTAPAAYNTWKINRTWLLQLGTIQEGMAEAIIRRALRNARQPSQESPQLVVSRIFNARTGAEYPLTAVRAGDCVEVVDFPIEPEELRRFFIVHTLFNEKDVTMSLTPERPERTMEALIAAAQLKNLV